MQSPYGEFDRNSAILVVSCSDARLTAEDAQSSWKNRLNFDGNIFEFRCPGGGIALADDKSVFYESAYETFRLLGLSQPLNTIVLSFHEDCAYFNDKYGSSGRGSADDKQRKFHLADEAIANVMEWSPSVEVVPYYIGGLVRRERQRDRDPVRDPVRDRMQPDPRGMADQRRRREWEDHVCDHDHEPRYAESRASEPRAPKARASATEPTFRFNERATLRTLERQMEDRILHGNDDIEQVLARAEGDVREAGAIPPWHVERRAREFIELVQSDASRKRDSLRASVRSFVQNYAGEVLSRGAFRAISDELDSMMQPARSGY